MYIQIDIIRLILLKLKVKALIRCQCVCKEWRSIIQDPDFKLSYRGKRRVLAAASSRSLLDVTSITNRVKTLFEVRGDAQLDGNPSLLNRSPPEYRWWTGVWCSCNGLVLFSVRKHIFLWNPSTHSCTKVLDLPLLKNKAPADVVSGLCYLPSTGDYKAVLLFYNNGNAMVASLKNKDWRKVPFPYKADYGVNFHNTLHWGAPQTIIYFEAESDEFKELSTPESHKRSSFILGLGIIDGCLCMVCEGNERGEELQVWVMKEYGVKESWVSQFVIAPSASKLFRIYKSVTTLYSSKCNTKVLICHCYYGAYSGSWKILVYDLKNNKLDNHFSEKSKYYNDAGILSYVQSIVSPHEFIWRDEQPTKNENEFALRSSDPMSKRMQRVAFNNTRHPFQALLPRTKASASGVLIGRCEKIIYFEGESDEFKELPTPELCGRESVVLGLGIIDGCLCMIHKGKEIGKNNVLVMKEYGVKKSWSPNQKKLRPVLVSDSERNKTRQTLSLRIRDIMDDTLLVYVPN
nr:F-box/kelch-repeat protein At3g23880-like [Ipomoea batatas]